MRKVIGVLVAAVVIAPAGADDGAASLAAGGIVFASGTPVQMRAEDLYISPKRVRVRFEFFNPTTHDVTTLVAFPLPDLEWAPPTYYGPTTHNPVNFVGFKVNVNGESKVFQSDQRAILKGRDITGLVKRSGLPVNAVYAGVRGLDYGMYAKGKPIPPDKRRALVGIGAIEDDTEYPNWITRTRFYWTQVFRAGATTVIEHEYQPVSGNWNTGRGLLGETGTDKEFCATPEAATRANRLTGAAYQTQYILKTAKTWNGPIGRFHMTLDKLKPENVLSLCWRGTLRRTSPTTFEFSARDYVPVRDIDMAVLE